MKQLLQDLKTGKPFLADVPIPRPSPGTALIRTAASLVSSGTERMVLDFAKKNLLGKARARPELVQQILDKARREGLLTTLEAAFNRLDQPLPLGYSSAGTILAVGDGLQGFQVGERVACGGGGYAVHAEYAIIPRNLMVHLPDEVSFDEGAFATLGAIALHGFRLAEVQVGSTVGIIGLGLLGLLTVGIAQAAGCRVLGVDLDSERIERAQGIGAEAVLPNQAVDAVKAFTHGRGVDTVIICADTDSNDPVHLAGELARDQARVIAVGAVGLDIPRKLYFEKEVQLLVSRSYGPGRYDKSYEEGGHDYPIGFVRWTEGRNLEAVVDLLAARRLDVTPLITHRIPFDTSPAAYDIISGKTEEPFLGVLLTYPLPENETKTGAGDPGPIRLSPGRQRTASVRMGMLGAGNFATNVLLPALRGLPDIERVGIFSAAGLNAQQAGKKFGFGYAASDPEELLRNPDINTIAIMTRHDLHSGYVVRALAAGKHVFCEKPLGISEPELAEIRTQLEQPDQGVLTVGFNRRFAPFGRILIDCFEGRKEPIFAHYRVNAGLLPTDHWLHDRQIGGGRIIGEACHFIDFLTAIIQELPESVTAHGLPDGGIYQEDNVQLTFQYPGGSIGTLSYLANGDKSLPKERLEVFRGGDVAILDDFRRLELISHGRRKVHRARLRQDKGHRAIWEAFIHSIRTAGQAPIPYAELLGISQASITAVEALRTGARLAIPRHL